MRTFFKLRSLLVSVIAITLHMSLMSCFASRSKIPAETPKPTAPDKSDIKSELVETTSDSHNTVTKEKTASDSNEEEEENVVVIKELEREMEAKVDDPEIIKAQAKIDELIQKEIDTLKSQLVQAQEQGTQDVEKVQELNQKLEKLTEIVEHGKKRKIRLKEQLQQMGLEIRFGTGFTSQKRLQKELVKNNIKTNDFRQELHQHIMSELPIIEKGKKINEILDKIFRIEYKIKFFEKKLTKRQNKKSGIKENAETTETTFPHDDPEQNPTAPPPYESLYPKLN